MLKHLASTAERETWSFEENDGVQILRTYIFKTFERCNRQGKILFSKDNKSCCVNTGLITENGKEIMLVFVENNRTDSDKKWYMKGFWSSVDREYMDLFDDVPELASYTNNYEDYYFNPDYNIEMNTDHILDDNWDRLKEAIGLPKDIVKMLLTGVLANTQMKVKRNMRLAVPQYYNEKIMYLLPIKIPVGDGQSVTMALAIEKTATNQYRANTIFTREVAYEKARLLMKPESNWLIE